MQILMAQADEWVAGLQPRHAWLLGPGPPLQGTEAKRGGASTFDPGSNCRIVFFTMLCDLRQILNLSVLGFLCI